jgi:hypothetical protein
MRVWLLCGMLLWLGQSWAETLRVEALYLTPEAAWQRGDSSQEREEGVYMLEWPHENGLALQAALLRQATLIRGKPEDFLANLGKKWAARYGRQAHIVDIEVGDRRWLSCRRPAREGDAMVFQLATVHAGRAYSLVAFAPPGTAGLPRPVHDLLAAVKFGQQSGDWVASRVVTAQPGQEALESLVQGDAGRIGQDGLLTGYGIEYLPLPTVAGPRRRLDWFLDGFRWSPGTRRGEKQPIALSGHLDLTAPARISGALNLNLVVASSQAAVVEIRVLDLCAPSADVDHALTLLGRGAREPLDRLARERSADCPAAAGEASPRVLTVPAGKPLSETLVLPVLPAQAVAAGLSRIKLIAVQARYGEGALGASLLGQTGMYFAYVPE